MQADRRSGGGGSGRRSCIAWGGSGGPAMATGGNTEQPPSVGSGRVGAGAARREEDTGGKKGRTVCVEELVVETNIRKATGGEVCVEEVMTCVRTATLFDEGEIVEEEGGRLKRIGGCGSCSGGGLK